MVGLARDDRWRDLFGCNAGRRPVQRLAALALLGVGLVGRAAFTRGASPLKSNSFPSFASVRNISSRVSAFRGAAPSRHCRNKRARRDSLLASVECVSPFSRAGLL
jgi:hypothetical protein